MILLRIHHHADDYEYIPFESIRRCNTRRDRLNSADKGRVVMTFDTGSAYSAHVFLRDDITPDDAMKYLQQQLALHAPADDDPTHLTIIDLTHLTTPDTPSPSA